MLPALARYQDRADRGSGTVLAVSLVAVIILLVATVLVPIIIFNRQIVKTQFELDQIAIKSADIARGLRPGSACDPTLETQLSDDSCQLNCVQRINVVEVWCDTKLLGLVIRIKAIAGPPPVPDF